LERYKLLLPERLLKRVQPSELSVLFQTFGNAQATPAAQKSPIVTPSGTSTLVITPTAGNAAGKPLQMPPIQVTLVVN
jgi:hypothetical protein